MRICNEAIDSTGTSKPAPPGAHARKEVCGDPSAGIGHLNAYLAVLLETSHPNRAALWSELDGVGQEIPEHLLKPSGIRGDDDWARWLGELERDAFCVSLGANDVYSGVEHLRQIDRLQVQLQLAGHDPRQVQQ
jgi:hypothetical protein